MPSRPLVLLLLACMALVHGLAPRHAHAGHAPHVHLRLWPCPADPHDDDHDTDAVYLPDEPALTAAGPRIDAPPDVPAGLVLPPVADRPVFAASVPPRAIPPPGRFALPLYLQSPSLRC